MRTRILFAVALAAIAIAVPAHAAQRTFVASFGNDVNSAQFCPFSAPCRTFSVAVSQTDPLGEVIVLDSAGYGAVTIAKSVSIIAAPGIYAGISVFINEGININLAGIRVVLRGLTVNGQGGDYGIRLMNADELHIENCVVSNVNLSGIVIGGSGARVYIKDTVVRDNSGDGIEIAGGAFVSADHVRIEDNGFSGVDVNGPAQVSVANSVISGNGQEGVSLSGTGNVKASIGHSQLFANGDAGLSVIANQIGQTIDVTAANNALTDGDFGMFLLSTNGAINADLASNTVSRNGSDGIRADGSGTTVVISRNSVTRNATGLAIANAAVVKTRTDNTIELNTSDVSGATAPAIGK